VEKYIRATMGTPIRLTPLGVPLDVDGVPLYGESADDITALYNINEQVENFSYTVEILSSNIPDIVALERELTRFTPAHISFLVVVVGAITGSLPGDLPGDFLPGG
jgi:hypothetical protein